MRLDRRAQVDVGDQLSVNNHERLSADHFARVIERAAGSQDNRLMNILQPNAELAAVTQRRAHRLWPVMQVDDYILDALLREILRHIAHQRLSQDGQRRLRSIGSQRPKPLAETGRENHRFHRELILMEMAGSATYKIEFRWHAHLARDFTGATPVPLLKSAPNSFEAGRPVS